MDGGVADTTRANPTVLTQAVKIGGAWGKKDLGLARVSKGCHMKFRGHNFESCVTNCAKISFFSLRSRYGKFRGFHPSYYKIRSVSDLQNPTATPLTQAGAAHRGTRLSAPHTITMLLFYQTITVL